MIWDIRGQFLPPDVIIRHVATCTWWFFWSLNTLNIPTGVQSVWFSFCLVESREQFGHAPAVWGIVMRCYIWIHSTGQQTFSFEAFNFFIPNLFSTPSFFYYGRYYPKMIKHQVRKVWTSASNLGAKFFTASCKKKNLIIIILYLFVKKLLIIWLLENIQHVKDFFFFDLWLKGTCFRCCCGSLVAHVIGTLKPTCFAQMS